MCVWAALALCVVAARAADTGACGCSGAAPARSPLRHLLEGAAAGAGVCVARASAGAAEDMALVLAGDYELGTDNALLPGDGEGPARVVRLREFRLDRAEVSVAQWAEFVEASAYHTDAEQLGDSFVFGMQLSARERQELQHVRAAATPWWYKVPGATWRRPHGLNSTITETWRHPVTHVSWRDAAAYCAWRGARLPSEAEWEAACRAGRRGITYPWGNKLFPNRTHMANIWQGEFPHANTGRDGYVGTNPVDAFPQNALGLCNMIGNVWEWTADVWQPRQPEEKVKKGGSFLCHRSYCTRYRCAARAHNSLDSSASNLGFRCAR